MLMCNMTWACSDQKVQGSWGCSLNKDAAQTAWNGVCVSASNRVLMDANRMKVKSQQLFFCSTDTSLFKPRKLRGTFSFASPKPAKISSCSNITYFLKLYPWFWLSFIFWMINISFSNHLFLPPWGLELYLVHRKPKSCCVPSAEISELLKTVCRLMFLYGQTMLLRMRSTVRKKKMHTSFGCLICEDSAFRKKASKRLWEMTATQII